MTVSPTARHALLWSYAGTAAKIIGQFALTLVLARLLGPEPYGVMTVAMLPIGLGALVADAGLATGLVQHRQINPGLIRACLWWQMLFGLACGLVVVGLALPLAHALRAPHAAGCMLAVAAVFPLNALAQVPAALLKRDMRFRDLQIASVTALVIGNAAVGLPLALAGAEAWALVAAILTQALVNAAILWWRVRPPWSWRRQPWPAGLGRFGMAVIGLNLANWTITNTETIALSRLASTTALGTYNRLTLLSTGLVGMLIPPLQGVLLSHHARQQDDRNTIRRQWRRTTGLIAGIFGLMALPLLFCPDLVVSWTLGPLWIPHAALLRILALAMVCNAIMCVCGPVLQAVGLPGREFRVQVAVAALAIPLLTWGAAGGLERFATTVLIIAVVRCLGVLLVTAAALRPRPSPAA